MSNAYHDPISSSAPANNSTFNTPLGQLDEAINQERSERIIADNSIRDTANDAKHKAENADEYAKTTRNYHLALEKNARIERDDQLLNLIASESLDRIGAINSEEALREQMDDLERSRRIYEDDRLKDLLRIEKQERIYQDGQLQTSSFNSHVGLTQRITQEKRTLINLIDVAQSGLQTLILLERNNTTNLFLSVQNMLNALQSDIGQEANFREQADIALESEQQSSSQALGSAIESLTATLSSVSSSLQNRITQKSFWPDNSAELNMHNLRHWRSKLARIQAGEWGSRASACLFGNSADSIVEPLRAALGGSAGFVSAAQGPHEGQGVSWGVQGEWIAEAGYGLDGTQLRTLDDDAPGRITASALFNICQIHFLRHQQGGRFRARAGNGLWESIDTQATGELHGAYTLVGSGLTTETIEIEILTAPAGCSVVLFGLTFFNESVLVAHNAMSPTMTSARFKQLSMNSIFMDMLSAMNVDVSIFAFFELEQDATLYAENLLLAAWRFPNRSDTLLLLPPDSSDDFEIYSQMSGMRHDLRQKLYKYKSLPAAAIDLSMYMDRWKKANQRGLWLGNELSQVGGRFIANILLQELGILQAVETPSMPSEEQLQQLLLTLESTVGDLLNRLEYVEEFYNNFA